MQRALALAAMVSILAPGLPAQAATPTAIRRITAVHQITAVTVYPDRALVTRSAHLDLVPGTYEIAFNQLPAKLDTESVRSSGRGMAAVVLHGLDVKKAHVGDSPQQRLKTLLATQTTLQDQDRAQSDKHRALTIQQKLLQDLSEQSAPSLVRQLGNNRAKLSEWQETLVFIQSRLQETALAMQKIDITRRGLAKQLTDVNAQLAQVQSYRQTEVKNVPIMLDVTRAGGFDLDVTYAIGGARWSPSHEAQLSANGTRLNWRSFGMITQLTGEDWMDVTVKLSTARPAAGGSAPVVPDWLLSQYVAMPQQQRYSNRPSAGAPPPPAPSPKGMADGMRANEAESAPV
ncbi:MAG: mucoidy inhibitor MuiA family protein, partial [Candidatus Sericytochromatia bacterium]|nr:mucoidy inhibitor MuiA family protein [Candidatus Sericytochromatia bacterium]